MSLADWFRPKSRAVVQIGESSLEVEGDAEFVERYLDRFLAEQRLAVRAHAAQVAEVAAGRVSPWPASDVPEPVRVDGPPPPANRAAGQRTWRKKGEFVRVHSIDGEIAKVYSVEARLVKNSPLTRDLDLAHLGNVYAEDPRLVRGLKGDQLTLWHRLMPIEAETTQRSGDTLIIDRRTMN